MGRKFAFLVKLSVNSIFRAIVVSDKKNERPLIEKDFILEVEVVEILRLDFVSLIKGNVIWVHPTLMILYLK